TPRRRATSSHYTAYWMPSIARPTKGATCSCDDADPAGRGPRSLGRRSPRRQLPTVPSPRRELPRPGTGGRFAAPVRKRARRAWRAALGFLVRVRDSGRGVVLARGRAVALHTAGGAALSRPDRAVRRMARAPLLAGRARAPPPARGAAGARAPGRVDGGRVGRWPSGGHSVPVAGAGDLTDRRRDARAVGRPGGRARRDAVARMVQRHGCGRVPRESGAGSGE